MIVSVATTEGAGMGTGGIEMSAAASARRRTAAMERNSTKVLVPARACAHVQTRDATDTTLLTTTPVGASAASPARTVRYLIQSTVSAGGSQLPTHQPKATLLLQQLHRQLLHAASMCASV